MQIAGYRTVIHVKDLSDVDRTNLESEGFVNMNETDIVGNEMWEKEVNFIVTD